MIIKIDKNRLKYDSQMIYYAEFIFLITKTKGQNSRFNSTPILRPYNEKRKIDYKSLLTKNDKLLAGEKIKSITIKLIKELSKSFVK